MLVFVDMDGTISDFDAMIQEVYGTTWDNLTQKIQDEFWNVDAVAKRFFAESPPIAEGLEMVQYLLRSDVNVAILTSTGGGVQHHNVAKHKLDFLHRHGLGHLSVAFAMDTVSKGLYGRPGTALIDDRPKVLDAFQSRGGAVYLYTPATAMNIARTVVQSVRTHAFLP